MNAKFPAGAASAALILGILACTTPVTQNAGMPQSDLALTITAQAQIIQGAPSGTGAAQAKLTRTAHPRLTATPTKTPRPRLTVTPSPTATSGVPMVRVSSPTNCRSGPSAEYDLITAVGVKQTAEVVGKDTKDNYWIIKTPGGSGTCWLWGQYASVTGETKGLPEIKPPPTPKPTAEPSVPAAPKNVSVAKICGPIPVPLLTFLYGGTLNWEDVATNEKGYHVYLNGDLLSTVGPNVTSFPVPPMQFPQGTPLTMGVDAFNVTGKSATKSVTMVCP